MPAALPWKTVFSKALALGAPYVKMICMGRAMMIPGFLGANIEGVLHPERREKVYRQLGFPAQIGDRYRQFAGEIFRLIL